MPDFDVWDVVKVPFPYTNRPIQQHRPALVVAIPNATTSPHLLWVLMITSAANRAWPEDVPITDEQAAGLPAPSLIRPAKIATIEAQSATRIGHLPAPNRPAVTNALHNTLMPALTA